MIRCSAFEGSRCIASGDIEQVARKVKQVIDRGERAPVLVFDDVTGQQLEIDTRGSVEDVVRRLGKQFGDAAPAALPVESEVPTVRGPGRPKLGVVAREVTLLPHHWAWLNDQPGGASVTLRKLVEAARRANTGKDRIRHAQESTYRFMAAMAGNQPGFEEATRALYAGKQEQFDDLIRKWPADVRDHASKLAAPALTR